MGPMTNEELYAAFYKPRPTDPAESNPDYYDESDLMDPSDEYPNTIETATPWEDKAPLGVRGSGDRRSPA
jgi:hypothetical protein